jgi:HD superfamily phosphohydrolase
MTDNKIDLWKVTASVAITVLLTVIGMMVYTHFVMDRMDRTLERASSRLLSTVNNQQQAGKQRQQAQESAQAEKLRLEAAQRRYQTEKERAWQASYQASEDCQTYRNEQHMVECVNHRIRAKQEFEAKYPKYGSGRLD